MRRRKPGAGGKLYSFHGFPITNRLALSLNCLSCAREGPPVPRQHLEVHLVVLHETRGIPHSMAPFAHPFRPESRRGAFFHYHLPPFLSSRLFTHEDRRMYARLRLPVRVGRSTLWQDQSPGQTNPPPRRIVLCPPDPYRAKELPGDP